MRYIGCCFLNFCSIFGNNIALGKNRKGLCYIGFAQNRIGRKIYGVNAEGEGVGTFFFN